jgi:hypothetical protein
VPLAGAGASLLVEVTRAVQAGLGHGITTLHCFVPKLDDRLAAFGFVVERPPRVRRRGLTPLLPS